MRKTISDLQKFKNADEALVCLTAYSAPMAAALDAHVDVLLVGDSMGMVLYGMDSTRGVTLDMMIAHGAAVVRGSASAFVVVDLPYGTYEDGPEQALTSARRVVDETGCGAVKLEGGADMAPVIAALVESGIPVMGHIGLLPQSVADGKFKIAGRDDDAVSQLLADAKALEEAGAFAIVIEGTIEAVAARLSASIAIPTIGIGASAACDGQVLVSEDMLGLSAGHVPKFVRPYAQLRPEIEEAAARYAADVRARRFPGKENTYS